jgi:hypothetical protein
VKTKRTEIMIEIDEVICAGSDRPRVSRAWSAACGSETSIITTEQAAATPHTMLDASSGRVAAGGPHFLETPDGRLWVCVNSLD